MTARWKEQAARLRKKDKALERVERDLARLRPEVGDSVRRQFERMIATVRTAREYAPTVSSRQRTL